MSLHSSLKVDSASSQQRSVLTRIERIKDLMKKGQWVEGRFVGGLPKTKIIKLKTKKAKAKVVEGAEGALAVEGAAGAAAPGADGKAKAPAGAKAAPAAKAPAGKA